ncbi:hypothetical protein MPC4_70093 [Methylocella tundrae]|uniref:Uncharacterized protein n=1 Tax=Methylocella tundrae TaxID=227605 RepID=A0A8B6MCB9_METTU|nr:hypothetical protein MPC4_70093 [Methylocella tundrae]
MARKSLRRVRHELLYPSPQNILMEIEVPARLRNADAPIPNGPHGFDLELLAELSPLHGSPPAS